MLLSFVSLLSFSAWGQIRHKIIERHVAKTPKTIQQDVEQLTAYLVQPTQNEFEKAWSFYSWIVKNIAYDTRIYNQEGTRIEQSIQGILQRKRAVCWGYSKLFKTFCQHVDINCEVISGYTSSATTHHLDKMDHAWNVVQLEGQWYAMDVTWAANTQNSSSYFMTSPRLFIRSHLPSNPMWQLLQEPITVEQFQQANFMPSDTTNNYAFSDSIAFIQQLAPIEKQIFLAEDAYRFNATQENKQELTQAYLNREYQLSEIAEELDETMQLDSMLTLQKQMLALCRKAATLTNLFDNQKESCARTQINYAVGLYRKANQLEQNGKGKIAQTYYQSMLRVLQVARTTLMTLPENLFTVQALEQCSQFIKVAKNNIQN